MQNMFAFTGVEALRLGKPTIHQAAHELLMRQISVDAPHAAVVSAVPKVAGGSVDLPIVKSTKTCTVDAEYARWFQDKELHFGREGVYFRHPNSKTRKFYVHNQVLIVAAIDGTKPHPQGAAGLREFTRKFGSPDVVEYLNRSQAHGKL